MITADFLFTLFGAGALAAAVLPRLVAGRPLADELWAVVAFTVLASVVLHGVTASPVISRLDRLRLLRARRDPHTGPEPNQDDVANERL
ncbi:hypothetical protein [Streptomyces sp. NPDC059894]|uniref:hypothetical protein n=1 Tax=unclassified Streptomyces TaxID=2593676 RepID=UPI003654EC63